MDDSEVYEYHDKHDGVANGKEEKLAPLSFDNNSTPQPPFNELILRQTIVNNQEENSIIDIERSSG